MKAANVDVEPYWPGLFAKALEGIDVKGLITNIGSGAGAASGGAAAAVTAAPAAAEEKKEEKKKESESEASDDDMGFGKNTFNMIWLDQVTNFASFSFQVSSINSIPSKVIILQIYCTKFR